MDRNATDLYHLKQSLGLSCGEMTTRQYVAALRKAPTTQAKPTLLAALPAASLQQPSRHFLHLAIGRLGI